MANTKITTNVIADDAITGAKIADDAINSEHYTDGSIDTAHIADDQVTLAKSYGCDCVLIIIAALSSKQADEIYSEALKHNLSVIVEVHNKKEAEIALKYPFC